MPQRQTRHTSNILHRPRNTRQRSMTRRRPHPIHVRASKFPQWKPKLMKPINLGATYDQPTPRQKPPHLATIAINHNDDRPNRHPQSHRQPLR